MGFKPTAEQQRALDARGSVLVSAAAGSGKTAVLSHRVVERIMDKIEPIGLDEMLIVTFTNAAAAEMRERISTVLTEYAQEHPENFRALEQKAELDCAAIGTIDSFCIDLIRDNFEAAQINPDFRIASNEQLSLLEKNAVSEALNRMLLSEPEEFKFLISALGTGISLSSVEEKILKIYHYTQSLPFPEVWLDAACDKYNKINSLNDSVWAKTLFERAFDQADYHKTTVASVLRSLESDAGLLSAYGPALSNIYDLLCAVCDGAKSMEYSQLHRLLSDYSPLALGSKQKVNVTLREYAKSVFNSAKSAVNKLKEVFAENELTCIEDIKVAGRCVNGLCALVRDFTEILSRMKKERNLYSFADIEHAALRLLCEWKNGEICVRESDLTSRFKEVLVDEYQDTNDLQNAIFYALSDCGKNLFLVGDVKQSIYRFRRANPTNFIEKKESYPEYDGTTYPAKISLSGNFRSRADVCDFVNFVFRLLMAKKTAEMDYLAEDELRPMGDFAEVDESAVELHIVPTDEVEVEASYVAKYIAKAVRDGELVSDGKGGLRPVEWRDFTVLLRSCKKNAEVFLSAMKKAGVPAWTESKEGFFGREEIQIALSLLKAIDNPLKDVPLLATLMSPVFSFDAEQIAQIRLCDRKGSLYSALCRYARDNEKAKAFLSSLSRYRDWSGTVSSDRLIRMVIDDTGLSAIVRGMDDGSSRRANLLMLAECAAEHESNGFKGLTSFLRYLDNVEKRGGEIPAAVVCESENVVRIRSIHKSKGLQSPVCILACMTDEFNLQDSYQSVVLNESMGIGLRICDDEAGKKYDTLPRRAMSYKETEAVIAEEMRLLYVALTRVQDRLVMVCADSKADKALQTAAGRVNSGWEGSADAIDPYAVGSANSYAQWIYMACLLHPSCASLRDMVNGNFNCSDAKGRVKVVISEAETADVDEASSGLPEQEQRDFARYFDFEYPYEKLLSFEAKYSVSQLAKSMYSADYCCTSRPAFITGEKLTAAQKGTATHRFMCFADYSLAEKSVDAEIERLVVSGRLTSEQGEGIDRETVRAFFDSSIYARIKSADRVLRESRFIYELPVKELDSTCDSDETVVVQGVADCVIFESDGITILDFKTDRNCTEYDLINKYTRQLQVYSDAFSSNYSIAAKPSYIYSFYLKKEIMIP